MHFYQKQNKWKHNLVRIDISKNELDKVIDLLLYKNHYALIKKLHVFSGNHIESSICRRCLNSYITGNMLMLHTPKCEDQDLTAIRTSSEPNFHWKDHFHKNPLYFRIFADFGADNAIDNSSIGNKTISIYEQNPVCNGYFRVSEFEDVVKSG